MVKGQQQIKAKRQDDKVEVVEWGFIMPTWKFYEKVIK